MGYNAINYVVIRSLNISSYVKNIIDTPKATFNLIVFFFSKLRPNHADKIDQFGCVDQFVKQSVDNNFGQESLLLI